MPGWLMSMGAAVSGNPSGVGPGGEEEGLASPPQEGGNGPLNLAAAREGWVAQRIKKRVWKATTNNDKNRI